MKKKANGMRKIVAFCDDSDTSPFWSSNDQSRAGFSDQEWGAEWEIHRLACPGDSDSSWTQRFFEAISNVATAASVYVVTDANFGGDGHGGSRLLGELLHRQKLVRGVVFSTALPSDPSPGDTTICAIKDDRSAAVATKIRHFLETGCAPAPDPETQIQTLSRSIHQLENLALPLRLDVETLEARRVEPDVVKAVWEDYFSSPADGGGFLLSVRTFTEDTSGIENEIIRILESVRSVPRVTEREMWKALDSDQGFSREKVAKELGIADARDKADSLKSKPDDLKENLAKLRTNIIALANELRELRNQLEEEEKGGQS